MNASHSARIYTHSPSRSIHKIKSPPLITAKPVHECARVHDIDTFTCEPAGSRTTQTARPYPIAESKMLGGGTGFCVIQRVDLLGHENAPVYMQTTVAHPYTQGGHDCVRRPLHRYIHVQVRWRWRKEPVPPESEMLVGGTGFCANSVPCGGSHVSIYLDTSTHIPFSLPALFLEIHTRPPNTLSNLLTHQRREHTNPLFLPLALHIYTHTYTLTHPKNHPSSLIYTYTHLHIPKTIPPLSYIYYILTPGRACGGTARP